VGRGTQSEKRDTHRNREKKGGGKGRRGNEGGGGREEGRGGGDLISTAIDPSKHTMATFFT